MAHSWPVSDGCLALRGAALALLEAVDVGRPTSDLARVLALDALRVTAADSPAWRMAVAVLEGGPMRARRAVELAGLLLDAVGPLSKGEVPLRASNTEGTG